MQASPDTTLYTTICGAEESETGGNLADALCGSRSAVTGAPCRIWRWALAAMTIRAFLANGDLPCLQRRPLHLDAVVDVAVIRDVDHAVVVEVAVAVAAGAGVLNPVVDVAVIGDVHV